MLNPQTKAPTFALLDDHGMSRALTDFLGTPVLLYFYPKDDTPGCTKEACMIRDSYEDFKQAGITVLGVSADSVQSHAVFKEKYHLPFILLADTEKKVIKMYEADGLLFSKRISYLIDAEGMILAAYPDVDPATHAHKILADAEKILKK